MTDKRAGYCRAANLRASWWRIWMTKRLSRSSAIGLCCIWPHLHRRYSDHWAIPRSGAEVHDQTSFVGLQDTGDHVIIQARQHGEPVEYRARQVIGADGPSSPVTRAIYPDYPQAIPWFFV